MSEKGRKIIQNFFYQYSLFSSGLNKNIGLGSTAVSIEI